MTRFFVYGVLVNGVIRYFGKGSVVWIDGRKVYDRLDHYMAFESLLPNVTPPTREKMLAAKSNGDQIGVVELRQAESEADAYRYERELIQARRSELGPNRQDELWNKNDGGHSGWTLRLDSRRKMSLARVGRTLGPLSEETRRRIGEAHRGRQLTEEHRQKIADGVRANDRSVRYDFSEENLLAGLARRQPHNALLSPDLEIQFLREHRGKTAEEIRRALSERLGRNISSTGAYSLIRRYGGLGIRLARAEGKIERAVRRRRESTMERLGITEIPMRNNSIIWGDNRTVYVVHGPSCSGKTWLCKKLVELGFFHVDHDAHGNYTDRLKDLVGATFQPKPIVFDVLRSAVSWKTKNPELDVRYIVLLEDKETIMSRARERGATINPDKLVDRMARAETIARRHATFSGTSSSALSWFVGEGVRRQDQEVNPTGPGG